MALPLLLAGLVLFTARVFVVNAQFSLAQCDATDSDEDYTWMTNSRGQSPCLVAAYLLVPCVGPIKAEIRPLERDSYFSYGSAEEPTLACGCNTVMYSMLQACSACQEAGLYGALSWSIYSMKCTDPTLLSYGPKAIPPGTAIPAWAFQDVTLTNNFNVSVAQMTGDTPESTALPTSTATSSGPSSSSTASSGPSASPSTDTVAESGNGHAKSSKVGAIVGGVVGGILGVLLLGSAYVFMLLRQRRLDRKLEAQAPEPAMATVSNSNGPSEKPMSILSVPSMVYDPDDPRTFPAAIDPVSVGTRAASPTPSVPPGSIAGHMHSFSALQNYPTPGYNGSERGHGYAGSTYRGAPEI